MPTQKTRCDTLALYLTGASSDGGAQADPDASLGNYRSSTLEWALATDEASYTIGAVITPRTAGPLGGANGTGTGTLTAIDADTIAWTPPGGSIGAGVAIANGETKLLEGGGGEKDKWIVVTRSDATAMSGSESVVISRRSNAYVVVGFDDMSSAEVAAGDENFRCICAKNWGANALTNLDLYMAGLGPGRFSDAGQLPASGAGTIQTTGSFADWPESGWVKISTIALVEREIAYYTSRTTTQLTIPAAGRGLRGSSASAGAANDSVVPISSIDLGIEAPSSQPSGNFTDKTGAGETSDPGVGFSAPLYTAEVISIGTLAAGYQYGIWLRRKTPTVMQSGIALMNEFVVRFDAG